MGRGTLTESDETLNPEVGSACNEAIEKLDKVLQEERSELGNLRNHINRRRRKLLLNLLNGLINYFHKKIPYLQQLLEK